MVGRHWRIERTIEKTGEGQNFEQSDFKMADISNLKINDRANVERPDLRKSLQ